MSVANEKNTVYIAIPTSDEHIYEIAEAQATPSKSNTKNASSKVPTATAVATSNTDITNAEDDNDEYAEINCYPVVKGALLIGAGFLLTTLIIAFWMAAMRNCKNGMHGMHHNMMRGHGYSSAQFQDQMHGGAHEGMHGGTGGGMHGEWHGGKRGDWHGGKNERAHHWGHDSSSSSSSSSSNDISEARVHDGWYAGHESHDGWHAHDGGKHGKYHEKMGGMMGMGMEMKGPQGHMMHGGDHDMPHHGMGMMDMGMMPEYFGDEEEASTDNYGDEEDASSYDVDLNDSSLDEEDVMLVLTEEENGAVIRFDEEMEDGVIPGLP